MITSQVERIGNSSKRWIVSRVKEGTGKGTRWWWIPSASTTRPHSEALHVVERFRRSSFDTLEYQATIEDPNVFEKPWIVSRTFPLRPELERVDEFVCENNQDYSKLFKKE